MKSLKSISALASIALAISAQPAQALLKSYETTFSFSQGDRLIMYWSYDDPSAVESDSHILGTELESWSYNVVNPSGELEFSDNPIIGGIQNPLFLYQEFHFNLASFKFNSFNTYNFSGNTINY